MHEVWAEHPPSDWLKAAELQYKPPEFAKSRWERAMETSKGIFDWLRTQGR